MADPEERIEPDGGRPRRQPPIIEGEAVEISVDGSPAAPGSAAARAGKVLSDLMSLLALPKAAAFAFPKVTAAVAAGVAAVIIAAGASWLYFSGDGGVAPAPSDDITGRAASVADAAPATPDRIVVNTTPETDLENRLAAVNAALAAMNDRIAALDRSVRESAAAAARAEQAARAFDETKKSGDEQGAHDVDHGALDDLAGRLKTLESRQMTMLQIQDRLDRLDQLAGQAAAT
ncbi:MAG: hypothetical protein J2P53_12505, partial [Bradyrhizobiaceae bacterium]|nr:hypothetical protein [Bradyrhizobiaceae bacterium]